MKREKLFDAITDIRDHLILGAEKSRKWRIHWIAPVAAAAALVLVLSALLYPGGNPAVLVIAEAAYPEIPARPQSENYESFDQYQSDHDAWLEQYRDYVSYLPEETIAPMRDFFAQSIGSLMSDAGMENCACSPLNLYMALGLLSEITGGSSRQQILDLLDAEDTEALRKQASTVWKALYSNGTSKCIPANSIWLSDDLSYNSDTLTALAEHYFTSSYRGDMGSDSYNRALQDWLNTQTDGLLQDQIGDLSMAPNTVLGLASTVYFSTKWYDEFRKEDTREQVFHTATGDITCDFLNEGYKQKDFYWSGRFSATFKNFDEGNILFMLPDEGVSFHELLQDEKALAFLAGDHLAVESKYMKVSLSVPKFDISSRLELSKDLQDLGISEVFGPNADFSPLTKDAAFLSEVQHGNRVAIDEEGCVATAYTVMIGEGSAEPPKEEIDFILDRPFLFAIYSNGVPLFVGIVNQT